MVIGLLIFASESSMPRALLHPQVVAAFVAGENPYTAPEWMARVKLAKEAGLKAPMIFPYSIARDNLVREALGEDLLEEEVIVVEDATPTFPPVEVGGPYTAAEAAEHTDRGDCWIIIDEKVYDVTNWLSSHPGGAPQILKQAGKDASLYFSESHSAKIYEQLPQWYKGDLVGGSAVAEAKTTFTRDELEGLSKEELIATLLEVTGSGGSRANNYDVASNMPPDEPTKRVDMFNIEDIAKQLADSEEGEVKFCRCWSSTTFPFCDGSHDVHNVDCTVAGSPDNAAPFVINTSGTALADVKVLADGTIPMLDESLAGKANANRYGVPSTMPPDDPTKRVDIIDIEALRAEVKDKGEVKFCRCWSSSTFPFCDGSHDTHNLDCGDNTGPVVLTPGSSM